MSTPAFATRAPELLNSQNRVSLSLPLLNTGVGTASNILITGLTLGAGSRVFPGALPFALGSLAQGNAIQVNASFSTAGIVAGGKYLVSVRGTYTFNGATYGFGVNRPIVVPTPVAPPVALLAARVTAVVDQIAGAWTYTISNEEPAGSPRRLNSFSLDVVGPILAVSAPFGWVAETDNQSFVLWYAADAELPYPNHLSPGLSLGGFQVRSQSQHTGIRGFAITSWNNLTDQADLALPGGIAAP